MDQQVIAQGDGHLSTDPRTRVLNELCNEMVRIYKEIFGRGPTRTRADWAGRDALLCTLEDTLTPVERKMVEVGSGYSSLLTADVNRRFLGGGLDFTCVEPYPPGFLKRGVPGVSRLIEARVQDLGPTNFGLGPWDVLFIDSTHVGKVGSMDVARQRAGLGRP